MNDVLVPFTNYACELVVNEGSFKTLTQVGFSGVIKGLSWSRGCVIFRYSVVKGYPSCSPLTLKITQSYSRTILHGKPDE